MKSYTVNDVFHSIQGEGVRAGTANIFVRFAGCNMQCEMEAGEKSPGGFDCDTEFTSGRRLTAPQIHEWIKECGKSQWIIFTGGEPGLQVDNEIIDHLHGEGFKLAIETNGSIAVGTKLDWITVSPKVAEHAIRQKTANEVKYVRGYGQAIPNTVVRAEHYVISPAFNGMQLDQRTLDWCVRLVKENPKWRLSPQCHKFMGIR